MFAPCELHVYLCVCVHCICTIEKCLFEKSLSNSIHLGNDIDDVATFYWKIQYGCKCKEVGVLRTNSAKMSPWFTIHHTLTLQTITTKCERLAILLFDCKIVQINSVNMIFVSQLKIIIILFDGVASTLRRVLFFFFSM